MRMTIKAKRAQVIYADPPWQYQFVSPTAAPARKEVIGAGGAAYYYKTMSTVEIASMPVSCLAETNAACFLWATVPMLPDAFVVLKAWGFRYKTMLTWQKLRCKGMGYWFRGHTEHLLFGVRGKIKAFRCMRPNIFKAPVQVHSEKPELVYEIIEEATADLPQKVELFARRRRTGWKCWGNEVGGSLALKDGEWFEVDRSQLKEVHDAQEG